MARPIKAVILPQAIQHNLQILQNCAKNSSVFAVLKANAYGHGIENIFSGLKSTKNIAVLDIEEAILLRQLGFTQQILLLEGFFHYQDIQVIIQYNLTTTIHNIEQINMLDAWFKQNNRLKNSSDKINIFLKMNTGMNRLGFLPHIYLNIYKLIRQKIWLNNLTHMTHFANADRQSNGIDEQLQIFNQITNNLPQAKSTSNSAAILWHKNAHFSSVRAGIALYGASPSGIYEDIKTFNLIPSMHLESEIIAIQNIKLGQQIGYGGRFIAPKDMCIGIVACGYADGYPRHAPDGTPIIVDNILTKIVGKVSMDMITIDISTIPHANIGTKVQLWGDKLAIDKVAYACETIGYELMCAITPRVKKIIG